MALTVKHNTLTTESGSTPPIGATQWDEAHEIIGTVSLATEVAGTLPFANGGTNATSAADALTSLGAYPAANPSGFITSSALSPYITTSTAASTYQPLDGDLTAIAALAGTTGIIRKTAADTYTLDTATYLTGVTSGQVTTALGFTPYDAANPAGYTTNTGTVTSVGGTGTVNGITLTGTVTASGSLTLGGTLSGVDLTSQITGTLGAANGGTGLTSPGTAGNVLVSNGTAWTSAAPAGGGISYTTKTSAYTAADKDGILANTSAGAFTVTLPASPATGNQVIIADAADTWGSNNLTIARNGATIEGLAENLVCDINGASIQLIYTGTTWQVYAQIGAASGGALTAASIGVTVAPVASPTFSGTVSDALGKLRAIPQTGVAKTSSYTLTTADVGTFVNVGTGGSVTIPNSTFATGDAISIYNDTTGNITITCSITTSYIGGTNTDKNTMTLATRGVATILFISGTLCVVSGNVT